jgi:hypothetical protein
MAVELTHAGVVAIFGMLVSLIPLAVAAAYMFRPTDRLLSLMRPLTLATIFAALNTFCSGLANMLRLLPVRHLPNGYDVDWFTHGLSEGVTPLFVAFGFLAAAWLCVALGMYRHS